MNITKNAVASLIYTVCDESGSVIDSNKEGGQPLVYLHGAGFLIPGLENALEGQQAGDQLEVTVSPEDAYGEHHEGLVQRVPRELFGGAEVEVGMRFSADTDAGQRTVVVTETAEDSVVVDGNHPLAGLTLTFEVEVTDVRAATAEEISHGHVHGAGGCHH